MRQELSDVGFVHQAIFLQPSWCVFCFHFVMSTFTYLPDLYINGHNLVLALWFRVSQVYSFLYSRFQELSDHPTKLWGPFTLKFFWNSEIVAEIIQRHIYRHLLFGLTGINIGESSVREHKSSHILGQQFVVGRYPVNIQFPFQYGCV